VGGWSLRRIAAAKKSSEPLSEPGGHGVVEDRVDGGVDVEHQTREVQEVVEQLHVYMFMDLVRRYDHPYGQNLEGKKTGKEEYDNSAQHPHYLPPALGDGSRLSARNYLAADAVGRVG